MPEVSSPARLNVLRQRLRDAQSIMGCGDTPDIGQAVEEIERIEREITQFELAGRRAKPVHQR